nr:MAG TPA: single-stranded-DNA-specific exonuclease RecJ [Caudoviricetes sp.]
MNYKLIDNSLNDINNPKKTILLNRGINEWEKYLNLNENNTHDYNLLKNIDKAVECVKRHIENNSNIHVIVDSDVDGYTSASMVYRYLKHINDSLNITYSLHTKKQHGLSADIEIPNCCNLVIIPDAGSNDVEQCKELSDKDIDVVILDHHICDKNNDYAIVVNNQMCDYPNKNFCGAGVVYKFLQAMDDELWENYADEMLDMVALGNISDVMDMRECETRYYVDLGLSKIRSKLFKALIDKQSYSMNNIINITSVQFYITPILNAMIRVGSQEDKELLFRAFIETDEVFKYKKRGETEEIDEDIYTRAARLCYNAKNRQGKEVQKGVDAINEIVVEKGICNDKVMFVNVSNVLGETLTGLVAIKIAEQYNRPCLLLRRQKARENGELYYGGSCRNFDNSPIDSLKDFLDSTETFEYVQGHDNAAGISISRNNVKKAIEICNEKLKDTDFSKCYNVDFDIDSSDLDVAFIKSIDEMKDIFGQGIKEPLVHITNILIDSEETMIMGKNQNSWKVISGDGYAFVKFNADIEKDELLCAFRSMTDEEVEEGKTLGTMDVVGTVSINNYNNILTPQIIVKDYIFRK